MRPPDAGDDRVHRATVAPLADEVERPLFSVMIPTYDCTRYLGATLESVLAQDPGPERMQIEVVDDHSTADDPGALVRQVAHGRVGFHRQPEHRGVVANLNTCLRRARGRLVHLLHGDDLVLPGFYAALGAIFGEHEDIGAAYCRHVYVDAAGRWLDLAPLEPRESGPLRDAARFLGVEQRVMTPCMVVRRAVYETVGGFDDRLACAEDWEMWVRIAGLYPVYFEQQPLACYRLHDESNTARNVRSGRDVDHTRLAIALFTRSMPAADSRAVRKAAHRTYARTAIGTARLLERRGDHAGMRAQLGGAWKLSKSPRVAGKIAVIAARSLAR